MRSGREDAVSKWVVDGSIPCKSCGHTRIGHSVLDLNKDGLTRHGYCARYRCDCVGFVPIMPIVRWRKARLAERKGMSRAERIAMDDRWMSTPESPPPVPLNTKLNAEGKTP